MSFNWNKFQKLWPALITSTYSLPITLPNNPSNSFKVEIRTLSESEDRTYICLGSKFKFKKLAYLSLYLCPICKCWRAPYGVKAVGFGFGLPK